LLTPATKAMDGTEADSNKPSLGVGASGEESVARAEFVVCEFEFTGVDVNRYKLAFVAWFDCGADLTLVDFIAAPREFLFAIAGLTGHHRLCPLAHGQLFDATSFYHSRSVVRKSKLLRGPRTHARP
jgi:hypothetical protein